MTDFTDWETYPYRTYGGANGKKRCMLHKDRLYMVKFFPEQTGKSSYGTAMSEHISCSIGNLIGLESQKTTLGYIEIQGHRYPAVACEDFCGEGEKLLEFSTVKNTVVDSSGEGYGKELQSIQIAMEGQQIVPPNELTQRFWDMFIFDALVANFDRHPGNFGIIANEKKKSFRIAPIYDCGSTLFPLAAEDSNVIERYMSDEKEQLARVYEYPNAAIKDADGKKIRYYDFISNGYEPDCTKALRRIVPRINMSEIENLIQSEAGIPDNVKSFYCKVLSTRKENILDFSFEKLKNSPLHEFDNPTNRKAIEKEKFLLENVGALEGAERRYAELYLKEFAKSISRDHMHLISGDADVKIASVMMHDKCFSKNDIAKAIYKLSPKCLESQKYINKIMVKARDVYNTEIKSNESHR